MASKARQSDFGGFFGLSLNFVILPFFMRLRSSCHANDVSSHRASDEKHPALDHANRSFGETLPLHVFCRLHKSWKGPLNAAPARLSEQWRERQLGKLLAFIQ